MSEDTPIERRGDDFVLHLEGAERRYRVTVPRQMLDDELGAAADEAERRAWIRANLDGVLGAVTARETGGFAKEPWGRVVVEELP